MGHTRRGRPYWYEVISEAAVRPAALVQLGLGLVTWASSDLSLPSPLDIVWFTRRRQIPVLQLPPSGESRTLSTEEAVEQLLNMNAPPTLYGRFAAATPSVIYIRAVRTTDYMAMYLLHEMRHAWQHASGKFPGGGREALEAWTREAEEDAEDYMKRAYPRVAPLIRQYEEAAP